MATSQRFARHKAIWLVIVMTVCASLPLTFASAIDNNVQGGYQTTSVLEPGTVVALKDGSKADARQIEAASKSRLSSMFGVTVNPNSLPFVFSGDSESEAYVATKGSYPSLVSTENGAIASGDYVTLSSVNGVLMKADTRQQTIFGRAGAALTVSSVQGGNMTLKDSQGKTREIRLGQIPVTIDIKKNPNIESTRANVPEFLEDIGQQIAKKEVSPIRIYLSVLIAAVSLIAAIIILYAGVRSGLIAIGRNPLSKRSIFRALLEVILTAIAVLMLGLFAVYLLLRL